MLYYVDHYRVLSTFDFIFVFIFFCSCLEFDFVVVVVSDFFILFYFLK